MEEYRQGLVEAGFSDLMIVDSGADLNTYAKFENQSSCCSPAMSEISKPGARNLPVVNASPCCGAGVDGDLHGGLRDLLARYDVNEYAASVKVFAVKTR